ncbi:MAG: aldehyde dehydrogenase family protein [Acidobacteria bacterium]|nr:aldehyde dehydrogenase family protein [Acidobacteriota bacterium]
MTRLAVRKTWKLYIGGDFPRSESGRYYPVHSEGGDELLANVSRSSRKDLRNAVAAARKAFPGWSGRTAYNRGQILYRMAEVAEARSAELVDEVARSGSARADARKEVAASIDRLVHYAGWADKYQQLFGSVNPVAGPFYNFSTLEPTGVVGIVAPRESALLGLISRVAPAIVAGNTVVVLASEGRPLPAITFAEILATSDLPGGVVNILTGFSDELASWLAGHMDVNAIDISGLEQEKLAEAVHLAAENVKRMVRDDRIDWFSDSAQSPYHIAEFQEVKTVWHPMGT